MSQSPQPASEGRIVHVHTPGVGHCQPALVVRAWGDGTGSLNLYVFPDGSNDPSRNPRDGGIEWATSIVYSEEPAENRTWHWPERV